MVVLYHTCELPNYKKKHKYYPPGPDTWCSYKRDGLRLQRKDQLDAVFLDFLLLEFKRLSILVCSIVFLFTECKRSVNNLVWNRAPKHRYKGAHFLETAFI